MPVVNSNVTVVATAGGTLLARGAGTPGDPTPVVVYNPAAPVWIGGPSVTTSSGIPLATLASRTFELVDGDAIYAIANTNTCTVVVTKFRS